MKMSLNSRLLSYFLCIVSLGFVLSSEANEEADDLEDIPVRCEWNNPLPKIDYRQGVEHHSFFSAANNAEVGFCIYFPPEYHESSNRYPVHYFLGGGRNDENRQQARWAEHLTPAIEEERIPPMILVWPNGMMNSRYKDSKHMKVETMIVKELIPYIDATYRTLSDRENRGIGGISMGGGGCLKLAFKYPELFSSVVSYAPTRISLDDELVPDHPASLVQKNIDKVRKIRVRIVCGEGDGLFNSSRDFHDYLVKHAVPGEFEGIPNTGHQMTEMFRQVGIKGLRFHANPEGN